MGFTPSNNLHILEPEEGLVCLTLKYKTVLRSTKYPCNLNVFTIKPDDTEKLQLILYESLKKGNT